MDQIEVEGLRIAYERAGTGPPLVLLHGILQDSRAWRRQLHERSDELTVVAWDAPGCGRSSDPPERFRLPDYADCLAAFVNALGLGRPMCSNCHNPLLEMSPGEAGCATIGV